MQVCLVKGSPLLHLNHALFIPDLPPSSPGGSQPFLVTGSLAVKLFKREYLLPNKVMSHTTHGLKNTSPT